MECTAQQFQQMYISSNHIPNQDTEHFYHQESHLKPNSGNSLAVQCLDCMLLLPRDRSLIPGQGTKNPQMECSMTKNKNNFKKNH